MLLRFVSRVLLVCLVLLPVGCSSTDAATSTSPSSAVGPATVEESQLPAEAR